VIVDDHGKRASEGVHGIRADHDEAAALSVVHAGDCIAGVVNAAPKAIVAVE